jgi:hypothetical protein
MFLQPGDAVRGGEAIEVGPRVEPVFDVAGGFSVGRFFFDRRFFFFAFFDRFALIGDRDGVGPAAFVVGRFDAIDDGLAGDRFRGDGQPVND